MADPFEEFEFKPLTEGLGFQKRKANEQSQAPSGELSKLDFVTNEAKLKLTSPLPTLDTKKSGFQKGPDPLTAKMPIKKPEAKAVEELVRTFKKPINFEKPMLDTVKGAHDQIQSWEVMPFVIDFLITAAIGLVGLIISLVTTKIDFMATFQNPNTDIQFYLALPVLFFGLGMVYILVARCFVGASIGEIVFDLQIGTSRDRDSAWFPLKVFIRSLLVTLSGIVLLPLASIVFGRDLAGEWTGTSLVRKV